MRHQITPGLGLLQLAPLRNVVEVARISGVTSFHTTPRRHGAPIIPFLLSALKASTALEVARTTARVALTFIPIILFKNHKTRRNLEWAAVHGKEVSEEKKATMLQRIRKRTILFHILLFMPFTLFWATILASMERTPLTGRWRLILLSPEEEDEIANQLAGQGWYQAVGEILSQDGPPKIVPSSDWRYKWVRDTLRRLENVIPVLQSEHALEPVWLERGADDKPLPPPADFPLRPRPRGSEYLRWFCEKAVDRQTNPAPHTISGPPYSLLVIDKPDASNAFSYGFGPDGGGGVVIYSGFLDDILSHSCETPPPPSASKQSWNSYLLGSFFSSLPQSSHPIPTPEQTSELAILLAHELAHLVLSHHLETLSSVTIIAPGVLSILSDTVRALLFPITMLFGPFVNDAVAQLGKVGSGEFSKVGEYCTSVHQEIEADVVSARLLAHAGFDARQAVHFWETRQEDTKNRECSASSANLPANSSPNIARRIMGSTHPMNETRVIKLKRELVRWELERRVTISRRASTDETTSNEWFRFFPFV